MAGLIESCQIVTTDYLHAYKSLAHTEPLSMFNVHLHSQVVHQTSTK